MLISRALLSCHSSGTLKSAATAIIGFKCHLFDSLSDRLNLQRYTGKHFAHDYYVLLVRRPRTLQAFGGQIVFPGGLLSESDSSPQYWPNLKNTRFSQNSMVPETYKKLNRSSCCCNQSQSLDPAISFRLCAIREIFEETGLLLVENHRDQDGFISAQAILLDNEHLGLWQNRVIQNASDFSNLYAQLGYSPPLRALHEWSSWTTPPTLKNRYDTMFYFVEIQLITDHEQKHKNSPKWESSEAEVLYADAPPAFLHNLSDRLGYLPNSLAPPQAYELCRLVYFENLDQLRKFSHERSHLGSRSWCGLPAKWTVNSKRCTFFILPGDQRYTEVREHWERTKQPANYDLGWHSDTRRNRFLIEAANSFMWFDSTVHELGHLLPISFSEFSSKFL